MFINRLVKKSSEFISEVIQTLQEFAHRIIKQATVPLFVCKKDFRLAAVRLYKNLNAR